MKDFAIILILLVISTSLSGQDEAKSDTHSILITGQLSQVTHYNPSNNLPLWIGGRYIPEIDYKLNLPENRLLDFELSVNIFGNTASDFANSSYSDGKIKPYRAWMRYSTEQFELRAGLQKINFGSASLLRPLMWFDQIDPRDPLRLTDGVWGLLARYYFLNNANIWLWGLYGNENTKGWEVIKTNKKLPEFGGRFQSPIPRGEAGLSYHHRIADSRDMDSLLPVFSEIPENRIGIDVRLDLIVGYWIEGSWIWKRKDLGLLSNQEILNLGIDYTFGIGNGIYTVFEQLIASSDEDAFSFNNTLTFSLLSVSYPIGLFDNLNAILYYNWTDQTAYNFISWQRQYNNFSFYLMGYWNPENYNIPTQGSAENLYAGKGMQVMVVYNH